MTRLLLLFFPFLVCQLSAERLKFDLEAHSAILMNADTGTILYEKEAHKLIHPASTTKIATALYTMKVNRVDLDKIITAQADAIGSVSADAKRKANYKLPPYWLEPDGTHIGIKKGEEMSMRDLLNGCLIASANDAANIIAQEVSTSIPKFMDEVNAYLKTIGCKDTKFMNPHGLHHPDHQTTAYDLATMTREALKIPLFREIIIQPRFIRPKTNMQASTTFLHTNRLIRPGKFYYDKAIGVKTGYHAKAKTSLVAAAQSGNRTLIAVLIGYQGRQVIFKDAARMFETAFNQPKMRRVYLKAGPQTFEKVLSNGDQKLKTYLPQELSLDYYPAEDPQVKCLIYWNTLSVPILKNQKVGSVHLVSSDGAILQKASLLAAEPVQYTWPYNWLRKISIFLKAFPILTTIVLIIMTISLIVSVRAALRLNS